MRNPKLFTDLKLDIDSKNASLRPICKLQPIKLYAHLEFAFRISVVDSSTAEEGIPAD